MDHEVGPGLYKAVDWLLKLSRDNFGLHPRKEWQRGHGGRGSQNIYFQSLINALTWSNMFYIERGKRGGPIGEGKGPWQRNAILVN